MKLNYPDINQSVSDRRFLVLSLDFVMADREEDPITTKGMSTWDLALLVATKYYGKVTNTPDRAMFETPAAALSALQRVSPVAE